MSGLCVSDWMRLNCGDLVVEHDGRHIGRVEAIHNSSQVKVRWLDTRWISFYQLDELRKLRRDEQ
jgi:hypothetical protein